MPEALNLTEIDQRHLELLPARTVMSMFMLGSGSGNAGTAGATGGTDSTASTTASPTPQVADMTKGVPLIGAFAAMLFPSK